MPDVIDFIPRKPPPQPSMEERCQLRAEWDAIGASSETAALAALLIFVRAMAVAQEERIAAVVDREPARVIDFSYCMARRSSRA